MNKNAIYTLLLTLTLLFTGVSCSHSAQVADADLSDEAVAVNESTEETSAPVALMDASGSENEALEDGTLVASSDESPPAEQVDNNVNEENPSVAAASNEEDQSNASFSGTVDNQVAAETPSNQDETINETNTAAETFSPVTSMEEKVNRMAAPKKRKPSQNWQNAPRKPASIKPKDRVSEASPSPVGNEVASAIAEESDEDVPVLAKEEQPKLASVEIGTFAQNHRWLVAFTGAALIIFLFFGLTRNRAKKDMTL